MPTPDTRKHPARMPVIFAGHGSPMNAIEDNAWSRAFQRLGAELPRPKAVLAVSAHWLMPGTFVTANERPETIHDFGGFPRALYEVQYPARGDVDLARRISALVSRTEDTALRHDWGLDHGTWSVLRHYFPNADVPVLQLSLDVRLPLAGHLALGRSLAPLREDGVLIVASGNLTHNLRAALSARSEETPDWARRFDSEVTQALQQRDASFLERAVATDAGRMSHPSIDHYLPLLYAVGATDADDAIDFPVTGFDWGSLSMRSVRWS